MLLNKFKTKEVKTIVTVGECFKKKREKLGISIKDVGEKLRIKSCYLEDLEENNYGELPPDVYVKGFVKSYARLVGLDPEKMAELYRKEKGIEDKVKNSHAKKEKLKKNFRIKEYLVITPKVATVFLSFLILSVVGYYFWHQLSSFNSEPYLFVSSPFVDEVVNDSEITVSGETEIGAILKINGEEVFVGEDGSFRENIMLQPGKNILIIESVNRFNKIAKEERNIIYEKKLKPMPANNP